MTTFASQTADLEAQLSEALVHARDSRHGADCRCGLYRRPDYAGYHNSPFCSVEDFRWSVTVDRLLERIRRASF